LTNAVRAPDLAKADFDRLKRIFGDEKLARQVLNAAKRVSKKRTSSDASAPTAAPAQALKKAKASYGQPLNAAEFEASLALPDAELDEDVLKSAAVFTNRAPLVLAFAVMLLKHTMPEQPISSRLSLAQAVVSMNSKTKAVHVGLDRERPAEDEGWGEGQPLIRIMGRDVRVMKRWGYEWEDSSTQETIKEEAVKQESSPQTTVKQEPSSQKTVKAEPSTQGTVKAEPSTQESRAKSHHTNEPALWGVDLEALKRANSSAAGLHKSSSQLPIYTAQSARAYLLKSFETPKGEPGSAPVKRTAASIAAEKARNLGLLLGALELLYQSWADVLGREELDKRAWGWYVHTRPDVASGAAGWGGKGVVKLADILGLRRHAG
jgi:hypothetical protein